MRAPRRKVHPANVVAVAFSGIFVAFGFGSLHGSGNGLWARTPAPSGRDEAIDDQAPDRLDFLGERELLRFAFTDPAIAEPLLLAPIDRLSAVRSANESVFVPVSHFADAYELLEIVGARQLAGLGGDFDVLEVTFQLHDRLLAAYSYVYRNHADPGAAVLVIPGSGNNQSSGIVGSGPLNYQTPILDAFPAPSSMYVLIKPNEDIHAFHDGRGRKLNPAFVVSWHLNRGGSYSVSYIVQSIAVTKYLKTLHHSVAVAGLSQGGGAALLNALHSEPSHAFVFSGYSAIAADADWAGIDQLLIPDVWNAFLDPPVLLQRLDSSPTAWLFSYGRDEVGTYRIEAEELRTCEALAASTAVVECFAFDGAHEVPPPAKIVGFLLRTRGAD